MIDQTCAGKTTKDHVQDNCSSLATEKNREDVDIACPHLRESVTTRNAAEYCARNRVSFSVNTEETAMRKCSQCNSKASDGSNLTHSRLKRVSLSLKDGFFCLKVPYMMDTQFEKIHRYICDSCPGMGMEITAADIYQVLSETRKRKGVQKRESNCEEKTLLQAYSSLKQEGLKQGVFQQYVPQPLDNNLLSRQLAQLDHHGDSFSDLLATQDGSPLLHMGDVKDPLVLTTGGQSKFAATELVHRRVCHQSQEASVVTVDGINYILPSSAEFLLSNLEDFCDHLHSELEENGYDLVVLDPPWENKSVKRKKNYKMASEDLLVHLPLQRLARRGCLLALWVTNNERLEDHCVNTLLPAWGVTLLARWHWLKVTQTGDFISRMDEGHKKPYELLLLGRFAAEYDDAEREERETLPERKLLVSVPCSLHSKKPPLEDVLRPYLPQNARCLELFARNLWPGWTSWGREALKHQNLAYYEEI